MTGVADLWVLPPEGAPPGWPWVRARPRGLAAVLDDADMAIAERARWIEAVDRLLGG